MTNNALSGSQVRTWLNEFCLRYFQLRDPEGTLALLSPNFISVGTGDGEVAVNKEQFRRLLRDELQAVPWPLSYKIDNYTQHQRATTCWDCFCDVHIGLEQPEYGIHVIYHIRLTAGFHLEGERWFIDTMHASEASHTQEEGEFFPLSFALQGTSQINRSTQKELIEILAQLMPGGVVGGYVEDGFPLYVANDRMLQMAGYQSYEEFSRQIQGLVINSIHPDDREFVKMVVAQALAKGDQYEVQYRMKRRDGTDMWVHDIGRKTVADNGREAIISVLVDISEQINAKKDLEKAADKDPLTGLFNRKAGQNRIENAMHSSGGYLFVIMDLDNFKQVNDLYGHQQGDRALHEFAALLTHTFRRTDILFRLEKIRSAVSGTFEVRNLKAVVMTAEQFPAYPALATFSSLSNDGNTLYLLVFNRDPEHAVRADVVLNRFPARSGKSLELYRKDVSSCDYFQGRRGEQKLSGGRFSHTFPAHSLTAFEWRRE